VAPQYSNTGMASAASAGTKTETEPETETGTQTAAEAVRAVTVTHSRISCCFNYFLIYLTRLGGNGELRVAACHIVDCN